MLNNYAGMDLTYGTIVKNGWRIAQMYAKRYFNLSKTSALNVCMCLSTTRLLIFFI